MRSRTHYAKGRTLCVAAATLLWACSATADYAVVDSAAEVVNDINIPIAWMDNERVIFTALKPGQPRMTGSLRPIGRIVIWDTARGKVTDYADGNLSCYYDGIISYTVQEADAASGQRDLVAKHGPMGEEKEVRAGRLEEPQHDDRHTCRLYSGKRPVSADGRLMLTLKNEHGYLELKPKPGTTKNAGAALYHRTNGNAVELPVAKGKIDGAAWSEYGNGYLLTKQVFKLQYSTADPIAPPVLFLHSDGRFEEMPFPLRYFNKDAAAQIALTRKGMALVSGTTDGPSGAERAGLYLASGDDAVRLVGGIVGGTMLGVYYGSPALGVSPDGCKIAFRHGAEMNPRSVFTVKMVNVCDERPPTKAE